jgi:hypothetical protein
LFRVVILLTFIVARSPPLFDFKLWGVWTPRIFTGDRAWIDKIVGDWTVTGILNAAHTGFPWTPVYNVQVTGPAGTSSCGLVYGNSNYCTVRPAAYLGGALGDYSNTGFERAGGNFPNGPTAYFTPPPSPTEFPARPASPATLSGDPATPPWI